MSAPHPIELRERTYRKFQDTGGMRETASVLYVSPSCVSNFVNRMQEDNTLHPRKKGRPEGNKKLDGQEAYLRRLLRKNPATRIEDMRRLLHKRIGEKPSRTTVRRNLKKMKYSYKVGQWHATERDYPDVKAERDHFQAELLPILVRLIKCQYKSVDVIFTDETSNKTNMAPKRGWAPQLEQPIFKVPLGHYHQ